MTKILCLQANTHHVFATNKLVCWETSSYLIYQRRINMISNCPLNAELRLMKVSCQVRHIIFLSAASLSRMILLTQKTFMNVTGSDVQQQQRCVRSLFTVCRVTCCL